MIFGTTPSSWTQKETASTLGRFTTALVTHLDTHGLTLRTTGGQQVRVDRGWLATGQLDHGYAMTVHKAQGRTVHTALLLADTSVSAQAGYVALSRGTHANHLFLHTQNRPGLGSDCGSRLRYLQPDPHSRTSRPLARDARQHLATDHLDRGREATGR